MDFFSSKKKFGLTVDKNGSIQAQKTFKGYTGSNDYQIAFKVLKCFNLKQFQL